MSDYYAEFNDDSANQLDFKGRYISAPDLTFDQLMVAIQVWYENNNGTVFWIKKSEKITINGVALTQSELEEFFWIKLSAHNV